MRESGATPEALRWVKRAQQTRSQRTLEALLDAAEAALNAGKRFEDLSVAGIAAAADSSVGSFYARFPGKDALLHCLQIRLYEEAHATLTEALAPARWASTPLRDVIAAMVSFVVATYRERAGLRRALLVHMAADPRIRQRARDLAAATCAGIQRLLESRSGEIDLSDPATAADVCHRLVYATLDQALIFAEASPTGHDLDDETLAAELTRACLGYLGIGRTPT